MPRIAISYRRADAQDITGRIFDRLATRYGRQSVFRDIDNIRPGFDFRDQISHALGRADVLLVIVSPRWVGRTGRRSRINDEADPVRIEVETAIKRDIPVIPVLVGGAEMPRTTQLPDSIHSFVFRHAVSIDSGLDFDIHVDRLCRNIDRILEDPSAEPIAVSPDPKPAEAPATNEAQEEDGGLASAAPKSGDTDKPSIDDPEAPAEPNAPADNSEPVPGARTVEEPDEPAQTQVALDQTGSDGTEAANLAPPAPSPEPPRPEIAAISAGPSVAAEAPGPVAAIAQSDRRAATTAPTRSSPQAAAPRKRSPMVVLIAVIFAAVLAYTAYELMSSTAPVSTVAVSSAPSAPTDAAAAAQTAAAPVALPPEPAADATLSTPPNLPPQLLPADLKRFAAFDQTRAAAIAQAEKGADSKSDLDDLMTVLGGNARPITVNSLLGNWRCRTLKLGGSLSSLTIYTNFKCNISAQGNALIFQKVSGSQRTRGNLYRISDTRYVYVGAGSYNDDPPNAYGATPDMDEVAYLEQVAPNRLRMEFPKPHFESDLDIMELRK